jgi:hypothetical protein
MRREPGDLDCRRSKWEWELKMQKRDWSKGKRHLAIWAGVLLFILCSTIACNIIPSVLINVTPIADAFRLFFHGHENNMAAPDEASTQRSKSSVVITGDVHQVANTMPHGHIPCKGMEIYLSSEENPGQLIAITHEDGEFTSDPIELYENEIVHIWPGEVEGAHFDPEEYVWGNNLNLASYPYSFTLWSNAVVFDRDHPSAGVRVYGKVLLPSSYDNHRGEFDWTPELLVYLSVDSGPGQVVAIVDRYGDYEGFDISLTGPHSISVWVEALGNAQISFNPMEYSWMHEGGYEAVRLFFQLQT